MARYVSRAASGRMMRSGTVQASSSAGRKSVRIEPAFAPSSPRCSFGNRADVVGIENMYGRSANCQSRKRATTTVRGTLMTDHFSTLGIKQNASKSEIKTAYKRLAKQYHPDVCPGDQCQSKFIQIINAYESALNCRNGLTYASKSNCDSENYAEDCRQELEEWEDWMGWEGAGSLDFSVDFSRSGYGIHL